VRTARAIAWFLLTLLPRTIVLLYRGAAAALEIIDDLWGYEARRAVVALALVLALGFGSWRVFGAYLDNLAAATAAGVPASAPTPAATPAPDWLRAHGCGSGRISAASMQLRRAPGVKGVPLRKLGRNEHVTVLCDARVNADGYTWQRVISAHDPEPGWMAVTWLERLP
jgi:hypothetical protein